MPRAAVVPSELLVFVVPGAAVIISEHRVVSCDGIRDRHCCWLFVVVSRAAVVVIVVMVSGSDALVSGNDIVVVSGTRVVVVFMSGAAVTMTLWWSRCPGLVNPCGDGATVWGSSRHCTIIHRLSHCQYTPYSSTFTRECIYI